MYECHPANPRRVVDWRWRRAVHLVETAQKPVKKIDDAGVRRAMKFNQALRDAQAITDHGNLVFAFEDLYVAHDLYSNTTDTLMRSELEARLLARQPVPEIAARLQVTPAAVASYESVFFNVIPKLDNQAYILHQVLGRQIQLGLAERHFELLWKFYAYVYGPLFLDSLISTTVNPQRPDEQAGIEAAYISDGRASLIRKQMLAARTVPVANMNYVEIMLAWLKTREIDRESSRDPAEEGSLAAHINKLLESLSISVGKAGQPRGPSDAYKGSTDLRADEVRAIRAGELTPEIAAELEELGALQFPEPSNATTEQGSS